MQYIQTKYLCPTNNKCGRIKATTSYGKDSITLPYDHALDIEQAHAKVAMALARKLDWTGEYVAGGNETGYVFVIDRPVRRYDSNYFDPKKMEELTA